MGVIENVRWPRLLGVILLCGGAGALGSVFTAAGEQQWYPSLRKPPFTPPGAVFGPVWTTLYFLMAIAEYLTWQRANEQPELRPMARRGQALFALQLGLNVGWSFLFFSQRSPLAALIELIALWVAILFTALTFARVSRVAALLLVPYLIWTSFAGVLNASIWWLNRERPGALIP